MFCSGCGQQLMPGYAFCPQCGRPVAPVMPPVPGYAFLLENYASRVRLLAIVWLVYAGISLLLGFAGITFLKFFFFGGLGPWIHPWMHGSMPPAWVFPAIVHFAWILLALRVVLAAVAGWGLLERAPWGRIVAIIAAIFSILKFPFGTALGIWTLVVLLGDRNTAMYEQLERQNTGL
jgi:hypothetical protein